MKSFHKKRLLKLADFLETVPKHRFNLDLIAEALPNEKSPGLNVCGTAACAIGWLPQVFPRSCSWQSGGDILNNSYYSYNDEPASGQRELFFVCSRGDGNSLSDFDFAEAFFDINDEQSNYLFHPDRYNIRKGAKTVAHRIRKFVEENGKTYDVSGRVHYNPNTDGEDKEENYDDVPEYDYFRAGSW